MVRFFLAAWAFWVLFQQRIAEFSTSEWPPFIMCVMLGFVVMGTMILATVMAVRVTSFFWPELHIHANGVDTYDRRS